MKLQIKLTLALVFVAVMFTLTFAAQAESINDTPEPTTGRLIFSDYPKPDYIYTVDIFDLETNTRSALTLEYYPRRGMLAQIDEQYTYVSVCLAQDNPMFCSAIVEQVVPSDPVGRISVAEALWQDTYGTPVWSPDSAYIAFTVETEQFLTPDIYVMNADGSGMHDLTPDDDHTGYYFTWSPDSTALAFACHNEQALCIADIASGEINQIDMPDGVHVRQLAWSPDGSQIAWIRWMQEDSLSEIYMVNADGSGIRPLLQDSDKYVYEAPLWSPDGSSITFRASEGGNNIGELYVVQPDGSNLVNVSAPLAGSEMGAIWSPDGSQLAFFSYIAQEGTFLYTVHADGTNLRRITENSTWDLMDVDQPSLFWIP